MSNKCPHGNKYRVACGKCFDEFVDRRLKGEPMKKPDFETYLQDKHAEQYQGTDDLMPEDYEEWLADLDINDVIAWANEWMLTQTTELMGGE